MQNFASCQFDINVQDLEAPKVTCPPSNTSIIIDRLSFSASVSYAAPTSSDNSQRAPTELFFVNDSLKLVLPTTFPIGNTQLVYRAQDNSFNPAQCSWNFVVTQVIKHKKKKEEEKEEKEEKGKKNIEGIF